MVLLRLEVKVLPRTQITSPGFLRNLIPGSGNIIQDEESGKKPTCFLLLVEDPEEVTLADLACMILDKWKVLRPGQESPEIKKLVDDANPSLDLEVDMTVAGVWVNMGKARADGHDQRGAVRVIQMPAPYAPQRLPSIVQDWSAATTSARRKRAKISHGNTNAFAAIPEESSESDPLSPGIPSPDVPIASVENGVPTAKQLQEPQLAASQSQPSQPSAPGTPEARMQSIELGGSHVRPGALRDSARVLAPSPNITKTSQAPPTQGQRRKHTASSDEDRPAKEPRLERQSSVRSPVLSPSEAKAREPLLTSPIKRGRKPPFASPPVNRTMQKSPRRSPHGLGLGITQSPKKAITAVVEGVPRLYPPPVDSSSEDGDDESMPNISMSQPVSKKESLKAKMSRSVNSTPSGPKDPAEAVMINGVAYPPGYTEEKVKQFVAEKERKLKEQKRLTDPKTAPEAQSILAEISEQQSRLMTMRGNARHSPEARVATLRRLLDDLDQLNKKDLAKTTKEDVEMTDAPPLPDLNSPVVRSAKKTVDTQSTPASQAESKRKAKNVPQKEKSTPLQGQKASSQSNPPKSTQEPKPVRTRSQRQRLSLKSMLSDTNSNSEKADETLDSVAAKSAPKSISKESPVPSPNQLHPETPESVPPPTETQQAFQLTTELYSTSKPPADVQSSSGPGKRKTRASNGKFSSTQPLPQLQPMTNGSSPVLKVTSPKSAPKVTRPAPKRTRNVSNAILQTSPEALLQSNPTTFPSSVPRTFPKSSPVQHEESPPPSSQPDAEQRLRQLSSPSLPTPGENLANSLEPEVQDKIQILSDEDEINDNSYEGSGESIFDGHKSKNVKGHSMEEEDSSSSEEEPFFRNFHDMSASHRSRDSDEDASPEKRKPAPVPKTPVIEDDSDSDTTSSESSVLTESPKSISASDKAQPIVHAKSLQPKAKDDSSSSSSSASEDDDSSDELLLEKPKIAAEDKGAQDSDKDNLSSSSSSDDDDSSESESEKTSRPDFANPPVSHATPKKAFNNIPPSSQSTLFDPRLSLKKLKEQAMNLMKNDQNERRPLKMKKAPVKDSSDSDADSPSESDEDGDIMPDGKPRKMQTPWDKKRLR